jgi:hypothetical protein
LIRYFGETNYLLLPDFVTEICTKAFYESRIGKYRKSNFGKVWIPRNLEIIGEDAFGELETLGEVVFERDSKLRKIGDGSFFWTSLKSIHIPKSVENIEDSAFGRCKFQPSDDGTVVGRRPS